MVLKQVFFSFCCDLLPLFWSSGPTKNRKDQAQFMFLCPEGPLDRFGTTLGSILVSCWHNFELTFSVFSKMFGDVSDFC